MIIYILEYYILLYYTLYLTPHEGGYGEDEGECEEWSQESQKWKRKSKSLHASFDSWTM